MNLASIPPIPGSGRGDGTSPQKTGARDRLPNDTQAGDNHEHSPKKGDWAAVFMALFPFLPGQNQGSTGSNPATPAPKDAPVPPSPSSILSLSDSHSLPTPLQAMTAPEKTARPVSGTDGGQPLPLTLSPGPAPSPAQATVQALTQPLAQATAQPLTPAPVQSLGTLLTQSLAQPPVESTAHRLAQSDPTGDQGIEPLLSANQALPTPTLSSARAVGTPKASTNQEADTHWAHRAGGSATRALSFTTGSTGESRVLSQAGTGGSSNSSPTGAGTVRGNGVSPTSRPSSAHRPEPPPRQVGGESRLGGPVLSEPGPTRAFATKATATDVVPAIAGKSHPPSNNGDSVQKSPPNAISTNGSAADAATFSLGPLTVNFSPGAPDSVPTLLQSLPIPMIRQALDQGQLSSPGQVFVLHLNPPELGRIVLRIVAGGDRGIHLHFKVDNLGVQETLSAGWSHLESSLRAHGLTPQGFSIDLNSSPLAGNLSDQAGGNRPSAQNSQAPHSSLAQPKHEEELASELPSNRHLIDYVL